MLTLASAAAHAQGLQIRVLAGEDAVNVIQQKTAVAPLVEVRDRNGLPVAGVAVTFSIQGSSFASFPGAVSTLSAVTNAAGQATVAAVNPVAAGSFSIQVQAAFQGQTALATIAQSNVMTLAEVAAAGSAASSTASTGTAAGQGGGISGTTIGVIGGAVAGGALIATQVGGGDPQDGSPTTVTRSLTGSISGQVIFVHNLANGSTCTSEHTLSAPLTFRLNVAGDTATGQLFGTGSETVTTGGTCQGTRPGTYLFGANLDVTGSPGALTATSRQTINNPNPGSLPAGASEAHQITTTFSGAFDGSTVTGTIVYERTTTISGSISQVYSGSVTMPVTLRQ